MKMVKLTLTLKNEKAIELGKKTMMLSTLRLETKLLKDWYEQKTEAISMSKRENLTKVKIKNQKKKILILQT